MEKDTISKAIEEAKKRAEDYLDNRMIASFTLTNITHTRIGGFNARNRSGSYFEYPREQSLKGIWRWWLRVLLSGTALEDSQIEQIVNELLGSSDTPAKFRISLTTLKIDAPAEEQEFIKIQQKRGGKVIIIPRLRLLSMPSKDKPHELLALNAPSTLEIVTKVFSDGQKPEESAVVIYALILAITFSGIGSITRRGFGRFTFKEIRTCSDNTITNIIDKIRSANSADQLKGILNDLIRSAVITAEKIGGERKSTDTNLPSHPALDKAGKSFRLSVIPLKGTNNPVHVLERIGNSTMKSEWKYLKFGRNRNSISQPGGKLHTWVLGLPRYQENSGYEVPDVGNQVRRSSAILITPHMLNNQQWCAVVLGFKSLDWPLKIVHKPRRGARTRPPIDPQNTINPQNNFEKYFDDAFQMVENSLMGGGGP